MPDACRTADAAVEVAVAAKHGREPIVTPATKSASSG